MTFSKCSGVWLKEMNVASQYQTRITVITRLVILPPIHAHDNRSRLLLLIVRQKGLDLLQRHSLLLDLLPFLPQTASTKALCITSLSLSNLLLGNHFRIEHVHASAGHANRARSYNSTQSSHPTSSNELQSALLHVIAKLFTNLVRHHSLLRSLRIV